MSINNIVTGLGIALAVVSALKSIRDKRLAGYNIAIFSIGVCLLISSLLKESRDEKKDKDNALKDLTYQASIESIKSSSSKIITSLRLDSATNAVFQKSISDSLHLIKDAATGKPIKVQTINTTIDKARDVFIGNN